MWITAKVKKDYSEIFKRDLNKIDKKVIFYEPKFSLKSKIKGKWVSKHKPLLEGYIFCKLDKLKDKIDLNKYLYTRGLKYFLDGNKIDQNEIADFILKCKKFEDENGFIKNIFFKSIIKNKGKFLSGPFKNLVFKIIEKRSNKFKISFGNYSIMVDENSSNFYQPA
tara:strand:- start:661 stop:1158 length:498 start_codon:yes stop_codon:yes gene_type:complete